MSDASQAESVYKEGENMGAEGRVIRCLHPVFMVGAVGEGPDGSGGEGTERGDLHSVTDLRELHAGRSADESRTDRRGEKGNGDG